MTLWIGIDVSKATLAVCLLPQAQSLTLANSAQGHAQLLALLHGQPVGNVLLEATGGYERLLMQALAAAGLPVTRINPRRARAFAQAMGKTAKTDPIDAALLARMAELVCAPSPAPEPEREALYMACWSVIRTPPDFQARYRQLRLRGKCAKVAITACMRVLLTRLNAMARDHTEWRIINS